MPYSCWTIATSVRFSASIARRSPAPSCRRASATTRASSISGVVAAAHDVDRRAVGDQPGRQRGRERGDAARRGREGRQDPERSDRSRPRRARTDNEGTAAHDELLTSARSRRRACAGRRSRYGRPAQARRLSQGGVPPSLPGRLRTSAGTLAVPPLASTPVAPSPLRIAVLAPIAWRTPPRHYGPWELFASLLTEGLVAARPRRDPVRHRRLGDHRHAARRPWPRGWSEDADDRPQGGRVHAHRRRRSSAPPSSTSSTTASTSCRSPTAASSTRRWSPRSTASRRRGSSPSTSATTRPTTYVAISDADRHPRLHYAATIHHGIDVDAFALAPAAPATTCSSSVASTPTRAPPTRSRWRAAPAGRSSSPASCRTRRYFRDEVAPHVDGDRVRYVGPVDADDRSRRARRRPRPPAPHRLRRAVRLQRRRGHGVRHAGDRLRPRFDGRAHRRRADRLPRRRRRPKPRSPSTWPAASTAQAIRAVDRRTLRSQGDGRSVRRRVPRRAR